MRIQRPALGSTKTKAKFLLFPTTILGETRWLERVIIEYQYLAYGLNDARWIKTKFVNK